MKISLNNNININNMALDEKSVSRAQQKFMGMVYAYKNKELKGGEVSKSVKKAAKSMTKKAARDFAKTKHKGLPNHVDEEKFSISKKNIMLKEDEPVVGAQTAVTPAVDTTAGPNAAGAMPATDPNAAATGAVQSGDIESTQGTNNSAINKARDTSEAGWKNAIKGFSPQQLSESDLKYISKKALSILKEWTK